MKLYLLGLGHCDADKGMVLTPGNDVGVRVLIPIVGYLIETDDGKNILVDSGMHRKHIEDPEATFRGHEFGKYITPIMRPEDDIVAVLNRIGLKPSDIDVLVSTHFHFDHAGNHADFASSRIVTQRECYEYAKANPAAFPVDIWDLPQLKYEMIDGDYELAPGVNLIESSGHVPGHMSVVVRLPKTGTVVLAIDAIYTKENLANDIWDGQVDPIRGRASGHKLAELAQRENGLLITGHDPVAWSELRHAPDYYG